MDRLKGKTALITGAARGIGAQIARRFSEEGANVIINDLSLDAARLMADQIGGSALACDVSDPQAVDAMFEQVGRQFENLDILVNNAGISGLEGDSAAHERLLETYSENSDEPELPILSVTNEAWLKVLAVHLNGTFFCSRAALRIMMRDSDRIVGSTNIINMGSIMGTAGGAGAIAYCSAKAGILGLTRSLAR
jgi:3-oxoacyl-[acyl-carrier protein] reductase